jgi:hypothetical protein
MKMAETKSGSRTGLLFGVLKMEKELCQKLDYDES